MRKPAFRRFNILLINVQKKKEKKKKKRTVKADREKLSKKKIEEDFLKVVKDKFSG